MVTDSFPELGSFTLGWSSSLNPLPSTVVIWAVVASENTFPKPQLLLNALAKLLFSTVASRICSARLYTPSQDTIMLRVSWNPLHPIVAWEMWVRTVHTAIPKHQTFQMSPTGKGNQYKSTMQRFVYLFMAA